MGLRHRGRSRWRVYLARAQSPCAHPEHELLLGLGSLRLIGVVGRDMRLGTVEEDALLVRTGQAVHRSERNKSIAVREVSQ